MAVSTQSFTQLVQNQVAAIQGAVTVALDFTVGSILRAFTESVAAVALFLQAQVLQLLATTRFATSFGPDADSWAGDYGLTRLSAATSTGPLTFSRFTSSVQALIPVGAQAQTFDNSQQFTVVADTTNAAYNAGLLAYVVPTGTSSLTVLAHSVNTGAAANVGIGTVTQITTAIPNVDTVTNASAFEGGADAESDAAYKARFVSYISSLSKATKLAIGYAISQVQAGLSYIIVENMNTTPAVQYGNFYIVVDDGSGSPPGSLLTSVYNAVDIVRPFTSTFSVIGPTIETATIALAITTSPGYTHSAVATLVGNAITAYVNGLTFGQTLAYSRLTQLAYDASPGVSNVTGVTINSGTSDLTATAQQVIRTSSVSVA